MDDRLNFVLRKNFIETCPVTDVAIVYFDILARNFFHTFYTFALAVAEIIEYNRIIACIQKLHAGVRTDVSGAAGDKNRHNTPPSICFRFPLYYNAKIFELSTEV